MTTQTQFSIDSRESVVADPPQVPTWARVAPRARARAVVTSLAPRAVHARLVQRQLKS
eukprot:COSAG02_NODE_5362_length_4398_cov_2.083043_8_plen_58_part_00